MRGWAIDRDYFAECDFPLQSRVGFGQTEVEAQEDEHVLIRRITVRDDLKVSEIENPVRFRITDEDSEVYYGGAVSREWVMSEDALAYNIQQFGEADAGATEVQFRAQDLPDQMVENHRSFGATETDGGTEWVIVYG